MYVTIKEILINIMAKEWFFQWIDLFSSMK